MRKIASWVVVRYQYNTACTSSADAAHYTAITHCTHAKNTLFTPMWRNFQPRVPELLLAPPGSVRWPILRSVAIGSA